MKVGSLVYSTAQGLGILAKSFYDHDIVTDVMVIAHGKHEEQPWYPKAERITSLKDSRQQQKMREFCASMDVMLFFETPFDWSLIQHCKKSVLMPMYECTPERLPAYPDLLLCPSKLDQKVFKEKYPLWNIAKEIEYLPVPVEYPWKLRTKAEVFVHNAGHGGLKGRNGTAELLDAIQYIKSPIKLRIRMQERSVDLTKRFATLFERVPDVKYKSNGIDLQWDYGTLPYDQLFSQGDVFVFPEKFNGLSLPLQEARASGMLVMCGDRFPMNDWLPREPLIPVQGYMTNRIGPPYMPFEEAQFDPKAIAAKIDEWYGRDISDYSRSALPWAESMSWKTLGPKYLEILKKVVNS